MFEYYYLFKGNIINYEEQVKNVLSLMKTEFEIIIMFRMKYCIIYLKIITTCNSSINFMKFSMIITAIAAETEITNLTCLYRPLLQLPVYTEQLFYF